MRIIMRNLLPIVALCIFPMAAHATIGEKIVLDDRDDRGKYLVQGDVRFDGTPPLLWLAAASGDPNKCDAQIQQTDYIKGIGLQSGPVYALRDGKTVGCATVVEEITLP